MVAVPDTEYTAVLEAVEDIEEDLDLTAVADEVGDDVSVFEIWRDPDTDWVILAGVNVPLGVKEMVGEELEVLLGLVDMVKFPVLVDEPVTVALALLDFVPTPDAEVVGVAVFVLEDIAVLDIEGDPVEVLELVIVLVPVFVIGGVNVPLGEREPEAEAVDVLEGRMEAVWEPDAVCVLDCGADLV